MISFIVIGRNEGWKLEKCLQSINNLVSFNSLRGKEIIYIDSDSDDNSIETAWKYSADRIYRLTGTFNSAVARNEGASAASGDILFFIDGDIEIRQFEISSVLNPGGTLISSFIAGFLDDLNYTADWKFIDQNPRTHGKDISDRQVTTVGGGIFIIGKETWMQFGGMDVRLKRNQDRDLSLRMARAGLKGIRKKEIFGLHHTIPYKDSKRMWTMLFDGSVACKGVFIRKHLFNRSYFPVFILEEWTLIILVISTFATFFFLPSGLFYLSAVLIKTIRRSRTFDLRMVIQRILQDVIVLLSILFFFPRFPGYNISMVDRT